MIGKSSSHQSMGRRLKTSPKAAPKKPKKSVSIPKLRGGVPLLFIVVILIASVMIGRFFTSTSLVSEIRVSGNYFTEMDDIIRSAAITPGIHVDSLNYLQILDQIEALPYIIQAHVDVRPSGRIHIRVHEREPILLLIANEDRYYVDAQGIRLPRIPGKVVDVPIYYDLGYDKDNEQLHSKAFLQIRDFIMVARTNPLVHSTLSELAWTPHEGVIALSDENTVRLVFGHGDFNRGVAHWAQFYIQLAPERGMSAFRRIDFRYEGQIVAVEA